MAAPRSAPESTDAPAPSYGPAQAQDLPSARLMARLQHRRIEVLGERTDASQTFVNADGTLTYTAYAEPKWTLRGGSWVDLDATLRSGADGGVAPVASESGLVLSGGGAGALASMTVDGRKVVLTWPSRLPVPTLSGATATYENVLDGVDLQVTAGSTGGVEETLVVRTAAAAVDPALSDLAQGLATSDGATAATDAGGNLTVKDGSGRLLVNSPAPVMWDSATGSASSSPAASGETSATATDDVKQAQAQSGAATRSTAKGPGLNAHQARVQMTLSGHKLHLAADQALLSAKTTVFPVYIDPAYVPHPASGSTMHWDQVQQGYPTTSNYDTTPEGGNGVGYQGFSSPTGIERTYYQVGIPSAIWGGQVLSASMKLTESKSSSCGTTAYGVQAWSSNGIGASTTWSNAPAKVTQQDSVNFGPACTSTPSGNFDFLNQVTNAAANHWANITFVMVNSSETNDVQLKRFSSAASLSITYDSPPGTPFGLAVSPSPYLGGALATVTSSGTPTLAASSHDPDSDTVRLDFQVLAGTTVKASGSSPFVNSSLVTGAGGSWKPTTALADGAYTWKVRAYDGKAYSGWTTAQPLTVDTHAPGTTSVVSSAFPAGAWSGTADANGNFSGAFTFTPPTTDVTGVWYKLDGSFGSTLATTGAPVTSTLNFRAGQHTLNLHTVDAAGNSSANTAYVFYAGSGAALLTPAQGDRPARRVGLTGQGKSTDTGVTYQYRIGETDTWHNVPTADAAVRSSGAPVASWPLAAPGGLPAALTWNITDSLAQDGPVDVRAVFTDGTATDNSPANSVTVDRNADTAAGEPVGPGTVNLVTGDYALVGRDAAAFSQTFSRTASSAHPDAGGTQDGQASIFGPQWLADASAATNSTNWSFLRRTSTTSVAVVDSAGAETGFTAVVGGGWQAEPGAGDLALTGSPTGSFTLTDGGGVTTTFSKVAAGGTTWQVASSTDPVGNATTTVVWESVTSGTKILARPKYVIAATSAVSATACASTPATRGCRVLQYDYAATTTATGAGFGDFSGQVSQLVVWATNPGATTATATAVAQYAYDDAGRLRQVWDPRISPALKTSYGYDSDGRVITLTPPGELPWAFTYGKAGSAATASGGMLLAASRSALQAGTPSTVNGTATTRVVYSVPLSGTAAPYPMDTTTVATWGQAPAPDQAAALFPAGTSPGSNDGAALAAGDYDGAAVFYLDGNGRLVNTALPGGAIDATAYDRFGNTTRTLTAANRALALGQGAGAAARLSELGLSDASTADRAQALSDTTTYGADGSQEMESLGSLNTVVLGNPVAADGSLPALPAGSAVAARTRTVVSVSTDTAAGTVTTTSTSSAAIPGYTAAADSQTTVEVDDLATGQGLKSSTGTLLTTTAYSANTHLPISHSGSASNGSDASTYLTTYYTATGTGTCGGHPEWADWTCQSVPAAPATGSNGNPTQLPTTTYTYNRYGDPAVTTVTANGSTRTTTDNYDSAGRATSTSVTADLGSAVATRTTGYDASTGRQTSVTADGQSTSTVYDQLGRVLTFADATGAVTTNSYDILDRVTRRDTPVGYLSYGYDSHGRATQVTDSVAGTFGVSYDDDGQVIGQTLPGGITMTQTWNTDGTASSRSYDLNGTTLLSDQTGNTVRGDTAEDSALSDIVRSYNPAGLLTDATVRGADGDCTAYHFTLNANGSRLTEGSATSADGAPCPTTITQTGTHTYDSAGRIVDAGYAYDNLDQLTATPDGLSQTYFAEGTLASQTLATGRQTWTLDPQGRNLTATVQSHASGAWTTTATNTFHYSADGDDAVAWSADASGDVIRTLQADAGDLDGIATVNGTAVTLNLGTASGATVQFDVSSQAVTVIDTAGSDLSQTATNPIDAVGIQVAGTSTQLTACPGCTGTGLTIEPMSRPSEGGGMTVAQETDYWLLHVSLETFLSARSDKLGKSRGIVWDSDGCSNPYSYIYSRNSPGGYHFLHACQRHDFGYRNYKKQRRFTKAGKARIDNNFHKDMNHICSKAFLGGHPWCQMWANIYYQAVKRYGH
ncbi:phospholipase A2 [Streptomyces sp. NBC_00433]